MNSTKSMKTGRTVDEVLKFWIPKKAGWFEEVMTSFLLGWYPLSVVWVNRGIYIYVYIYIYSSWTEDFFCLMQGTCCFSEGTPQFF